MLLNTLRIGIRHIIKEKADSLIKLTGLSLGLSLCILLSVFILDERGYDRFHERAGRIQMLTSAIGRGNLGVSSTPFLGGLMKQEFPEVERAARYWRITSHVQAPNGEILEQNVALIDPSFFEIFTLPLKAGLAARALDGPDVLVLNAATAVKLFGSANPLGETLNLRLGSINKDFIINGVLNEFPGPSSLRFDMLISFTNYPLLFEEEFPNSIVFAPFFHTTFIELRDGARAEDLQAKFPAFLRKYYGQEYDKHRLDPNLIRLGLIPLLDYHLGAGKVGGGNDLAPQSRLSYSIILFGIALLVLFQACFNHVNISLGQASNRTKEIGIRKVVGARRGQLVIQFLSDALLLCVLATALAAALAQLFLPAFNALMGKSLGIGFLLRWPSLLLFPMLIVTIAILAGFWPAAVLSGLQATDIFKGKFKLGGGAGLTRLLIVLQFAVSIFLIVVTLAMNRQLRFMARADIGFDRENVIAVPTHAAGWLGEDAGEEILAAFERALRTRPAILSVTGASGTVEGLGFGGGYPLQSEGRQVMIATRRVAHGFLRTMGLGLVEGRDFSRTSPSDVSEAVIVNEAFVRRFNLRDPVGKKFSEFAADPRPGEFRYDPRIIGVVKNYHFASLRDEIAPLALALDGDPIIHVLVRFAPGHATETLALLRETWLRTNPKIPFSYIFMSDVLAGQYAEETAWRRVMSLATAFAIFIAGIGLFGLSALAAAHRTKEIGIRKIMGGSIWDIVALLSREFLVLVGVANLLAWPVAYIAARRWLEGFAFRAGISPMIFFSAAFLATAAAAAALGYHIVRAALSDPVNALRYE